MQRMSREEFQTDAETDENSISTNPFVGTYLAVYMSCILMTPVGSGDFFDLLKEVLIAREISGAS